MTENYVIVAVNPYAGKISDEVVKTTTKSTTTSMMGRHLTWVPDKFTYECCSKFLGEMGSTQ